FTSNTTNTGSFGSITNNGNGNYTVTYSDYTDATFTLSASYTDTSSVTHPIVQTQSVAVLPISVFSDVFAGSGGLNSTNWQTVTGGYTVGSNKATGTTSFDEAVAKNVSQTNVLVSANVSLTQPGSWAGLVARYSGPVDSNMYFGTLAN